MKRHAPNKVRERWNNKEEINKGPTTDNGVGASSWEIRTGFFSKSVTLWLLANLQRLPEWRSAHMCTWFSASWRRFRYDRKCLFSCIYNAQITISPTSLFSANFNGNRVENHPKPWTCPLSTQRDGQWLGWHLRPCREREEVSHKLTGSSLVTQRVSLAEHICEQRQGRKWRG